MKRESKRYVFLTKSCWLSALNSICPGCGRQETWGWVLGATAKCLVKTHLAALGWFFPNIVTFMLSKGPVLLLYIKNKVLNLAFCTKINWVFWPVTDTSNQAPSASLELPMHNRSLTQIFCNIPYKSLLKYLLRTPMSICHISDYSSPFLCIFHIHNHF